MNDDPTLLCSLIDCDRPQSAKGLCHIHYQSQRLGMPLAKPIRPLSSPAADRLAAKIEVGGSDDCWPWRGYVKPNGYGQSWFERRPINAHRLTWMIFVGSIPDGYEVDHLCRNRICCNPDHLEAVTPGENLRRRPFGPFCKQGHERTEENTYVNYRGHRVCQVCREIWWRERNEYLKEQRREAKRVRSNA